MVRKIIPQHVKTILRAIRSFLFGLLYWGKNRYCPVCKKSFRKFGKYGIESREDAICFSCSALERHRLTWLYFLHKTNLFDDKPKRMLHFAPEMSFEKQLKYLLRDDYITADLSSPCAMINMDIMDIQFPDQFFDVIYCSHVFEHVPDDRKAMRELFRVLKEEGWAVLLVPITADKTYEDITINDPVDRLNLFGHEDHVRRYGYDYADRLKEAGFRVSIIRSEDFLTEEEIILMGLTKDAGEIYYCVK